VERFVHRMATARVQKEEVIKEQVSQIGSGNLWKNKITIPKEPNLTTSFRNLNL
jgi:hypothetical protein